MAIAYTTTKVVEEIGDHLYRVTFTTEDDAAHLFCVVTGRLTEDGAVNLGNIEYGRPGKAPVIVEKIREEAIAEIKAMAAA
ncbi:hypothetical protein CCAX7_37320 [Capsulimonas corticalis]|uniref:Uncharacterized protein n=1 Tax=Capsulimonas corticalis TaxID=2219043 RepID=A0A402D132_9BACT|nr:hypothetical protein [Capsulimonas corticalis]BDI31681.1 hypothetical protein CCAX7_37320 [Capsulimonas corticalis]